MNINEVFLSIQGESTWSGRPTVFVRCYGCNLKCPWCDTKYAKELNNYSYKNPITLVSEIKQFKAYYLCFTGGEPMMQITSILEVASHLKGHFISMETNGSIKILNRTGIDKVVMDIKCPSAQVNKEYYETAFENASNLDVENDELKFVVANEYDLGFVEGIISDLPEKIPKIISPALEKKWSEHKQEFLQRVAETVKKLRDHSTIMQIQLHKIVWKYNKRGV